MVVALGSKVFRNGAVNVCVEYIFSYDAKIASNHCVLCGFVMTCPMCSGVGGLVGQLIR